MATLVTRKPNFLTWFSTSMIVLWLLIALGPFIWTVWGSFKVQGDFFSKADWRNAVYGVYTITETGEPFTGNGYHGAWVQEEFWNHPVCNAFG